jgi:CO/xanthine dehydrogenase FAD-binding subunit
LPEEVEQVEKEGIRLMPSWGPSNVLKAKGKLHGMELIRCTSIYDSKHRFAPSYDQAVKKTVKADLIILAIGQKPDLSYAEEYLDMDSGLIAVDTDTQVTSMAKVFAGGDATISSPLSVVAALASGRRAAESINQYLGGKGTLDVPKKVEHLTRCNDDCLEQSKRIRMPEQSTSESGLNKEDVTDLNLKVVEMEANRCFNCGCDGVNPSDIAPALVVLDARIITSKRKIKAEGFWAADKGLKPTILENDEIIVEIQIPRPAAGVKSSFLKFAMRKSIDFPIVNCAAAIESRNGIVKSARICLNAVYNNPYRVTKAENIIKGKPIDESSAEAAGIAAVSDAVPLPYNKFKIQIAKTLVKRSILACNNIRS